MASHDHRVNLPQKALLLGTVYTAIAPVIDVGGTLHADTKSLLFSTRGAENPEISGRSRTAALSEAQNIIPWYSYFELFLL